MFAMFRHQDRPHWILITLFVAINLLVFANTSLHDPAIGYDSIDHLQNVVAYAAGHFPTSAESREFFSPPLPYLLPAAALASGLTGLAGAAKLGQFINFLFSVGTTMLMLGLVEGSPRQKMFALTLFGMLPVFYKTFAMLRGEPYLVFFMMWTAWLARKVFTAQTSSWDVSLLGISLGLGILSRQWGFFAFPALGFYALWLALKDRNLILPFAKRLAAITLIAFIVGGWFYVYLLQTYGNVTAFNRSPSTGFSLSNQPRSFYLGWGEGKLFTDPVRPAFPNQLFPIFYSEMWGDYWAHFSISGRDTTSGEWVYGPWLQAALDGSSPTIKTNRTGFSSYLGRVNLVSLFPTSLLLAGFFHGLGVLIKAKKANITPLLTLFTVISALGYAWFLVSYPNLDKGDTIKATYILYVFPFLAILSAQTMEGVFNKWKYAFPLVMGVLLLISAHNLPAMLTHYIR